MKAKNIIEFLTYCWKSWELWQKLIILSLILNFSSYLFPSPWGNYMNLLGLSILAGMMLTFWFHHMLLPKWNKYKEERNQLLTTIKESDK